MSGSMSPNAFPQLSTETCSPSPQDTTLSSVCVLEGANGASTLLWGEWLSIPWLLGLSGRGCQRQLGRTGLRGQQAAPSSDRSLCRFLAFCHLGSRTGNPTEIPANTVPSRALIQAYLLAVKTRKKWCSRDGELPPAWTCQSWQLQNWGEVWHTDLFCMCAVAVWGGFEVGRALCWLWRVWTSVFYFFLIFIFTSWLTILRNFPEYRF